LVPQCYGVRGADGRARVECLLGQVLEDPRPLRGGKSLRPLGPLASVPPPIGVLPIATPSGFPIPDTAWTNRVTGRPLR
jgi:hypothetical protein